jgi:RNA polymerase sigma factor (sigma-70 family)
MMLARADAESLFLDNLPYIERILGALARRYGMRGDEADDFASWAKTRLIENDYAVLAKFRGESSFTTYLTVVLSMLAREYLVQQSGRWRPSAAARRAGLLATRLETLVYRDRLPLGHAGEQLRTSGETTRTDNELAAVLVRLPRREPIRPTDAGNEPLKGLASTMRADEILELESRAIEWERARRALVRALDSLTEEDRVVVRLRFWEGLSIADIARTLNVPQKPLYRRLERALVVLRQKLESDGIGAELARALTADGPGPESAAHVSIYKEAHEKGHEGRPAR